MKRGDTVEVYTENGWRTGVYDRTVESGKKFGLVVVKIVVPAYERVLFVRPEEVKELTEGGQA